MWTTLSTFGWTIRLLAALAAAAMIGLVITIRYAAPVYADESKLYLDCPTTEVREGDSVDVFLVRVTNHDHWWEYFGAYWFTDAGTGGTDDYEDGSGPIRWSYDAERAANRAIHTFEIRQDALVEGNETFTVRTDEGDIADLNDPDRDNKCDITIIDDDPNITEVAVTSSAGRDNTYGLGETIEISATFSTSVEVNGNPALGFWAGTWKGASYLRGSGSNTLVFGYTVKSDDRDGNGISMDGGYQDSNGTWHNFVNHTAVTAVGTDTVAYRVYRGLDQQSGHKVDGSLMPVGTGMEITSEPADGDTYRYGETIDIALTLSAPVDVEGAKNLNARVGTSDGTGTWRGPVYKSGSGTNTLVFGYTVQTRDLDTDGISIENSYVQDGIRHGWGGSGTVKVKGSVVVVPPAFTGLTNQSDHKLDGRPYPKDIEIKSTPAFRADIYGEGEIIQIGVKFDQNVTVGDDAIAAVGDNATTTTGGDAQVILFLVPENNERPPLFYGRPAFYVAGSGADTLVFEYRVRDSDSDDNGVGAALPLGLNIKAAGTEISYRPDRGGVLDDNPDHKVDGSLRGPDVTAPTVSSASITSDAGDDDTYVEDDSIEVTVTFNEYVIVTGTPQLELDFDGTARTVDYSSTNGAAVVFSYAVAPDDIDTDGIAIGANKLTLNGGAIKDAAENDAALTHDAVTADSRHKVEGSDTTAPTVSSVAITSDPGGDDTYRLGDAVEVTVTFSEDVTVTGTPLLELDFDGTAKTASYRSTSGADVVFNYTVARDESDADGIAIGADKLSLNEGTIKDGADNAATLTHDAVAADSGHKVDGSDTTAPTISSLSFTSDPGDDTTYGTGDTIQVAVTFSENVTITGTPQLELNMSGSASSARQASYSSSNSSGADVVFEYTVAVGDRASDGLEIKANKLTLNDGTIQDASGNDATLTHSNFFVPSDHFVNGAGGL